MRLTCLLLGVALLGGCGAPAQGPAAGPKPGPLTTVENTTWRIEVEPVDPPGRSYADRLRFDGKSAGTEAQQSHGFSSAAYTYDTRGEALTFEFTLTNPDKETFKVMGKATPDAIWGTMAWRRSDWSLRTYRFSGSQK